jgi:hypothetical protein
MACEKCRTINTPDCDADLCDIVLPADCVTVDKLECIGTKANENLGVILKEIDAYLCGIGGGADTDWVQDANGVWNNTDNIGIGTNNPNFNLEVLGDLNNVYNNNSIINANVNITSLFGNPDIIGEVAILVNQSVGSNSVVWASNLIAQLAVDTADSVTGVTSIAGAYTIIKTETLLNSTELTITATDLKIDGNNGATGSFTAQSGEIVTVIKGLITSII